SAEELNQTLRPGTQQELTGVEKALATDHRPLATDFFDTAEERIYAALRDYAESAEAGDYQRRLFAEDAAHGFAFIDLCRKRYEVCLMNPPFGEPTKGSQPYLRENYSDHRNEIMGCFLVRMKRFGTEAGFVGVISSRTIFFNSFTEEARRLCLFHEGKMSCLADLGWKVLDDASVEAAAYCYEIGGVSDSFVALRALRDDEKEATILDRIANLRHLAKPLNETYLCDLSALSKIPHYPLAYSMSSAFLRACQASQTFSGEGYKGFVGLSTADNYRFLRLAWEVSRDSIGTVGTYDEWVPLAKGGEYHPMYDDIHLLLSWKDNGTELHSFEPATIRSARRYGLPGSTYPYRTSSGLCLRTLPKGCAFSDGGHGLLSENFSELSALRITAYAHLRLPRAALEVFLGEGDQSSAGAARNYVPRAIESLPLPATLDLFPVDLAERWLAHMRTPFLHDETTREFQFPAVDSEDRSLKDEAIKLARCDESRSAALLPEIDRVDSLVAQAFGLSENDREYLNEEFGTLISQNPFNDDLSSGDVAELYLMGKDELTNRATEVVGVRRFTAKKMYWVSRRLELMCRILSAPPQEVAAKISSLNLCNADDLLEHVETVLSLPLGCVFGRWDIRYATGERQPPELPDPFDPLPVCPPGMLQNADGLPAAPADVPADYPLPITWPGILV
ncbi:BREX-1 system adenine-specific DNA-methyltransferase PglX, partial [Akkermansiaceae bacterium]|nr:BREX-1 system adenine-specific DNA-methyltransferase PglX [Akkermansiaceae bacterium]